MPSTGKIDAISLRQMELDPTAPPVETSSMYLNRQDHRTYLESPSNVCIPRCSPLALRRPIDASLESWCWWTPYSNFGDASVASGIGVPFTIAVIVILAALTGFKRGSGSRVVYHAFTLMWALFGAMYGMAAQGLYNRAWKPTKWPKWRGRKLWDELCTPVKWQPQHAGFWQDAYTLLKAISEALLGNLFMFVIMLLGFLLIAALVAGPALGGMVVTGMMIKEYGSCTRL